METTTLEESITLGKVAAIALGRNTEEGAVDLGSILGVPVRLHVSWFLVAALATWALATVYFPQRHPDWATGTHWTVGAFASILLFASVLLHELGHSVLAQREGVPVRSITLLIFGGVARMSRRPPTPGAEFRIAIAGPLTSFGLAGLLGFLAVAFSDHSALRASFAFLALTNLVLATFNMIPGFPLDGGRMLRALLWGRGSSLRDATLWASTVTQVAAFLFIFFGIVLLILGGPIMGLAMALIGWYLNRVARSGHKQVQLEDMLAGVKARNVVLDRCMCVPSDLRVDRLVADHILGAGQRCFVISDNNGPEGLVTVEDVRALRQDSRNELTAGQIMTPVGALSPADADDDLWKLLQRMSAEEADQVLVAESGHLLGLLTRENLRKHIDLSRKLAAQAKVS